jgi:hypothetical protein
MSNTLLAILADLTVWAGVSLICGILWGGWRAAGRRRAQRLVDEAEFQAIGRYWIQRVRRPR